MSLARSLSHSPLPCKNREERELYSVLFLLPHFVRHVETACPQLAREELGLLLLWKSRAARLCAESFPAFILEPVDFAPVVLPFPIPVQWISTVAMWPLHSYLF